MKNMKVLKVAAWLDCLNSFQAIVFQCLFRNLISESVKLTTKSQYLRDRLYYCYWVQNEQMPPQNTPYIQKSPQTLLIFHSKHVRAFENDLSTECIDVSRLEDVWSGSEKPQFLLDWLIDVSSAGERILAWHLPQHPLTCERLLIYLRLKKRRRQLKSSL